MIQLKVLTTAILWWRVFGTEISPRGWLSLVLLLGGSVIVAVPTTTAESSTVDKGGPKMQITSMFGLVFIVIQAFASAGAGIYTEWTYKKLGVERSLHEDNLGMYLWGMLSNGAKFLYLRRDTQFFNGFDSNIYIYLLIMSYSTYGLIVSQVMKYFSSIVKLFMAGSSIVVSGILTFLWFGIIPTWNYVVGGAVVLVAVMLYKTS